MMKHTFSITLTDEDGNRAEIPTCTIWEHVNGSLDNYPNDFTPIVINAAIEDVQAFLGSDTFKNKLIDTLKGTE